MNPLFLTTHFFSQRKILWSSQFRRASARVLGAMACITLVGLLLSNSAYAEQRLSSVELVEQVLASNTSLAARDAQREAADQRSLYAGTLDDPRLSYAIAPQTIGSELGSRHIIQLNQALPWPGKLSLREQLAREQTAIADTQLSTQREALIAEARVLWSQWWYVHRALQLNAATQSVVRRLIPVAEAQYSAGSGLQQDVLSAQTRAERVRLQRLRLQQQQRRLQAAINALRGQSPQQPLASPADLPPWQELPSTDELLERLAATDPRLQTLSAREQAANTRTALAEREFYPDLTAGIAYVGTLDPDEKRLQLSLAINVPLNQSRRQAEVDAAHAEALRFNYERTDLLARLQAELSQALTSAQEATEASVLYRQSLIPRAQQTLRAAQAEYESGRGDFANIVAAETQLLELQLELARTRADWRIAVAMLDQLTGGAVWPDLTAQLANSTSE